MKTLFAITWIIVAALAHADERIAVKAASGRFEVTQEFQEDDQGHSEFLEIVRFQDKVFPNVQLTGWSWPGVYHISPDECWMLRIQKSGSGASVGILYRLEKNGRVSEVLGFNDLLWKISDQTSRLKTKDLYHTGVAEFTWSKNSGSLEIVLHGTNFDNPSDELKTRLTYDLKTHKAAIKEIKSE